MANIAGVDQLFTEVARIVARHGRGFDEHTDKLDELIVGVNDHTCKVDQLGDMVNRHDRKLDDLGELRGSA